VKHRRPSDSIEGAKPSPNQGTEAMSASAEAPSKPALLEPFEE
jgi:hypothetical protein